MMTPQKYFDWTELPFSAAEIAYRRNRLVAELSGESGVFLTPARHHFSDGSTFRQLDDFYYFTGLELPDSMLVLNLENGEPILFVPEKDLRFYSAGRGAEFPGRHLLSDSDIGLASGIRDIRPLESLDGFLANQTMVWLNPGRGGQMPQLTSSYFQSWTGLDQFRHHLQQQHSQLEIYSAYDAIARLRMVKSAAEISLMRHACDITMNSIVETAAHIQPGLDERSLEGILESGFKSRGAQRPAFDSIIKSGPNSLWPWRIGAAHYDRRNRQMQAGEMVVFDVGCELNYYGSDMGRTFPVAGQFSAEQASVLDTQLEVLDAIIEAMRPGATMAEAHQAAVLAIPESMKEYMQVGLFFGHHIGLAMGDPNLPHAPFEPGMIITVEPWVYDHDRQLATFIEDVILITPDGNENLTVRLPRTAVGMASLVEG
ncbi:MAG: aminopeptidase P N-terminal domain-containing protein [Anaerolineae bacterium]